MLAGVRNIFFWLSFSLLLMHSIVPHHHKDHHGCQETHLSDSNQPKNPLSFFLQTQLGEGHLEHYLSEDQKPSSPFSFVVPEKISIVDRVLFPVNQVPAFYSAEFTFLNYLLEHQKPLRAPPLLG